MRPMITTQEILDALKVTRPTLRRWIELELFPRPLRIGGTLRWPCETIDEWIENGGVVTIQKVNEANRLASEADAAGCHAAFGVEGLTAPVPSCEDGEELADADEVVEEGVLESQRN